MCFFKHTVSKRMQVSSIFTSWGRNQTEANTMLKMSRLCSSVFDHNEVVVVVVWGRLELLFLPQAKPPALDRGGCEKSPPCMTKYVEKETRRLYKVTWSSTKRTSLTRQRTLLSPGVFCVFYVPFCPSSCCFFYTPSTESPSVTEV